LREASGVPRGAGAARFHVTLAGHAKWQRTQGLPGQRARRRGHARALRNRDCARPPASPWAVVVGGWALPGRWRRPRRGRLAARPV